MKTNTGAMAWITFIGLIMLLVGIYGSVRTVLNFTLFPKYPTSGAINLTGTPFYFGPREEDCMYISSPPPMMGTDAKAAATETEIQKKNCLAGVKSAQEQAKVNDIGQSALFLFLGVGILASRKYLFS